MKESNGSGAPAAPPSPNRARLKSYDRGRLHELEAAAEAGGDRARSTAERLREERARVRSLRNELAEAELEAKRSPGVEVNAKLGAALAEAELRLEQADADARKAGESAQRALRLRDACHAFLREHGVDPRPPGVGASRTVSVKDTAPYGVGFSAQGIGLLEGR